MKLLNNLEFCRYISKQTHGALLGLDMGTKQIGVAFTDCKNRQFVGRLGSIQRQHFKSSRIAAEEIILKLEDLVDLKSGICSSSILGVVIGLPLLENGVMTPFCHEIVKTVNLMNEFYTSKGLVNEPFGKYDCFVPPVCTFWNEYDSTSDAKSYINEYVSSKRSVRMNVKDEVAAALILEGFVNHPFIRQHSEPKKMQSVPAENGKNVTLEKDDMVSSSIDLKSRLIGRR
jgi:RNase H-fold protein (predicted Holliday junction resolvase)